MEKQYMAAIEDANDGTGDAIITLPDELLEDLGWYEGTPLELEASDGCIIVRATA